MCACVSVYLCGCTCVCVIVRVCVCVCVCVCDGTATIQCGNLYVVKMKLSGLPSGKCSLPSLIYSTDLYATITQVVSSPDPLSFSLENKTTTCGVSW